MVGLWGPPVEAEEGQTYLTMEKRLVAKNNRMRGVGGRYDKGEVERLEYERRSQPGVGLFLNYSRRICSRCNKHKSKKGGTAVCKPNWRCADCKRASAVNGGSPHAI